MLIIDIAKHIYGLIIFIINIVIKDNIGNIYLCFIYTFSIIIRIDSAKYFNVGII